MAGKHPARGISAQTFEIEGVRFILFRCPLRSRSRATLTKAEGHVVDLLCVGLSTAEIARVRRVSYATVAKQLDTIYRKLRVGSRAELLLRFGASRGLERSDEPRARPD
jgi:DNA-binding CsgD family transcriptional regulator